MNTMMTGVSPTPPPPTKRTVPPPEIIKAFLKGVISQSGFPSGGLHVEGVG